MGFPRQEDCSGLPFPFPGDLPNPGIELRFPALQADSLLPEPPGKPEIILIYFVDRLTTKEKMKQGTLLKTLQI